VWITTQSAQVSTDSEPVALKKKKVLLFFSSATTYFEESTYIQKNDIDVVSSSDIIRWHLARQATLAAMVNTADCGLR